VTRIATEPLACESEVGWATPPVTPRSPEALVGQVLGSYRVLEVVGSGGMGCVYRAEHVRLGRVVALKVLHEQHARRRDAALRLFQEARAASQIRHDNIVDVIDWLELEGGLVCIVMEYLRGQSLADLIASRLPVARVLDLAVQIAEALEAAHGAGIVHRDLKPDNVVVLPGDQVKLLDFGVAKLTADRAEEAPLTAAGQVLGTPAYMSPEQATGGEVDGRTDIYSLGAILYELFTGRLPFEARNFDEYAFKHLAVPPPSPSARGRRLHPRVDAIVMRCLAKRPADRFASAFELRAELLAVRAALAPRPRRPLRAALAVAAAALVGFAVARAGLSHPEPAAKAPPPVAAQAGPPLVRIVSDPPARVYPGGEDEPLCSTPCAIAVPPVRAARPVYTVKRRGYRDAAIAVDAEAPPSQVKIRLERTRGGHP
jgi:serine/threonine-protein kinase